MYNIEIPDTIKRIIGAYYRCVFWSKDRTTFFEKGLQIFHLTYFVLFVISMAIGAWIAEDKDTSIYSAALTITFVVHAFRMFCIIFKQEDILTLIDQFGKQSTNNHEEFIQISNKFNILMKVVKSFILICIAAAVFVAAVPMLSKEKLAVNIAFPLDWKNRVIYFWIAHLSIIVASTYGVLSVLLTLIIWYLMICCSLKYEILGNELRNVSVGGTTMETLKVSVKERKKLFLQHLIAAIKNHRKIDRLMDQFASSFDKLFLLQISTSSVCICGSIHTMVFNTDGNLLENGFFCLFILYSLFDIFTVMYLGNEIQFLRNRLSYCLYESIWFEQTESSKKYVIIMTEVLKRPKQLIIGKLYPLNLNTFTLIVKGAYSWFNLLKSLN